MSTDAAQDRLRALLAETPEAEPSKKTDHIAAAMAEFDHFADAAQENADGARPTSSSSTGERIKTGVWNMIDRMTSRGALAATTGLVAAAVALMLALPQNQINLPPLGGIGMGENGPINPTTRETTAPVTEAEAPIVAADEEMLSEPATPPAPAPSSGLPKQLEDMLIRKETRPGPPVSDRQVVTPGASVADQDAARSVQGAPALQVGPSTNASPRQGLTAQQAPAARLSSDQAQPFPMVDREEYANDPSAPVKITTEEPVSTFSVDVDTASYSMMRSSLNAGHLPHPDAVRIEEMVNYFTYDYPAPEAGGAPFHADVSVMQTPWNSGTQLISIGLQGEMPAVEDRPPLNLVFLIDTSGSMAGADRLPLLLQSFRLMLPNLRPDDEVAIVTYAGSAGLVLEPTKAGEGDKILAALGKLQAGGATAGQAGLQQAYATARTMTDDGEVSRIILATDGDFNVGIADPADLERYVENQREDGTYLTVLGFGRGNLNDRLMQTLAQNGNGQAAYIDTIAEAQKVLVDQLTGALFPIAEDVKVQVEFNPATVAEYRLIGYETRALRREDFNNDKVDAGEIGAGHQVTAIYEITPLGSGSALNDPLRYGASDEAGNEGNQDELGFLRLRWKEPGADSSQLIEQAIPVDSIEASGEAGFAVAMAGFGQLLRGSDYLGNWSWGDAIALAQESRGEDRFGYRAEAIRLMRLAEAMDRAQ